MRLPVEGAVIGEHLAFHERDERAAQDDHHVALGKHRVPDALEDGGERRVRLAEVLELVQRDDEALAVARQTVEENVPVVYGHLAEQLVARERGHLFLEGRAVLFLRLSVARKYSARLSRTNSVMSAVFPMRRRP